VRQDDVDKFEQLFRQAYPPLVRALAVASDEESAADAVQDAFVQLVRHWKKVAGYEDRAAWVRRVAVNRLLNQQRKRRRGRAALERSLPVPADELTPSDIDLADAVRRLPDGQRVMVCLHYLADLTISQVAAAVGRSEGTVKSQLHDARIALRAELEVNEDV
jgi:RNA polymerase sigma-70 factor (ECF subfamily)